MIEAFRKEHPEVFLLPGQSLETIDAYVRSRGWIDAADTVCAIAPAGEGNMNYTLRVTTNMRSMILKQSVPWVAKYPDIDAPWDRIIREARFFQIVSAQPSLARSMPALKDLDVISRIVLLEDVGNGRDGAYVYQGEQLAAADLQSAVNWLATLHNTKFNHECRSALTNRDMRALNHAHIFRIPLQTENPVDLDTITPGLQAVADKLKANTDFVAAVHNVGEALYLQDGPTLIHGDFFPGSWLITDSGLKVIDPEFSFFGFPEFDVGVLIAHLLLSRQSEDRIEQVLHTYRQPDGFSLFACKQIVGVEIVRRLIGVAQLPVPYALNTKIQLLSMATGLVLEPDKQSI